jgi:hypothetical protein
MQAVRSLAIVVILPGPGMTRPEETPPRGEHPVSRSHEKSAAVDPAEENVGGTQAMVGAVAEVSKARFGVEVSTARVSTVSFKAGVVF